MERTPQMVSNLLILCDIDRNDFCIWKQNTYGALTGLEKWVELPSFHRILMIFDTPALAHDAIQYLKKSFPDVHVFFGPSMPLDAKPSYLSLPDAGKLWFTSPPASPPGEWEQSIEDPPNKDLHHSSDFNQQLNLALLKYKAEVEGTHDAGESADQTQICVLYPGSRSVPRLQVELNSPLTHNGDAIPRTSMPEQ